MIRRQEEKSHNMIRNSLKIVRNNVSAKIESAVGGAECFFNFFLLSRFIAVLSFTIMLSRPFL